MSHAQKTFEDALTVLHHSNPSQLVIFSGAGISVEHPTHAPSGAELMDQAMTAFFKARTSDEIQAAYREMLRAESLPANRFVGRPRLEVVLDVASRVHGARSLEPLAENFRRSAYGRMHEAIALLIEHGARSMTANFDLHIEEAARAHGYSSQGHTTHFHGAVGPRDSGLPFGARLSVIEHGFRGVQLDEFTAPILDPRTRVVVFIGYSFSDYFDVTPAVTRLIENGQLAHVAAVLWLHHSVNAREVRRLSSVDPTAPDLIQRLTEGGVEVWRLSGNSGDILRDIAIAVGCQPPVGAWVQPICHCPPTRRQKRAMASRRKRDQATLELLQHFGLLGRLRDTRRDGKLVALTTASFGPAQAAAYYWKKGQYRRSHSHALAALNDTREPDKIKRALLGAQYAWIRGAYLEAVDHLSGAIPLATQLPEGAPAYIECLERFARLCVHIRRVPLEHRFLLPRLLRSLPDFEDRVSRALSADNLIDSIARRHLQDAYRNYLAEVRGRHVETPDGQAGSTRRGSIRWFEEVESLGNFADYVRGEANEGRWPYPLGSEPWQVDMKHIYDAVGNTADVRRMVLLTRDSSLIWGWRDAVLAARSLDVTNWNRARFMVKYSVERARTSLRQTRSRLGPHWHPGWRQL